MLVALADADVEVRTAALEALVVLDHEPSVWLEVARYANAVLVDASSPAGEQLRVVEATPWIPIASTRAHVARLASSVPSDPPLRDAAIAAIATIDGAVRSARQQLAAVPAGFTSVGQMERDRLRRDLAGVPRDELPLELRRLTQADDPRRAACMVTLLLETGDDEAVEWGVSFVTSVPSFCPDLEGLFALLVAEDSATPRSLFRNMAIRWVVSRGGVANLVAGLTAPLKSHRRIDRLVALGLIRDAALLAGSTKPPESRFPVQFGARALRRRDRPIPPRVDVLDVDVDREGVEVDDDVQFSLYRPSCIRPDEWVPFVAFAHRSAPAVTPDGRVVRPVEEVERRAAQLLSDLPAAYDVIRADSDAGLPRGTDIRFEPWIDDGEFNPNTQSLRWEEAVHEVLFRLRVPASREGTKVNGGMRVFVGPVLVGELTFRVLVSRDEQSNSRPTERDSARRFRNIFASYSHRDAEVVDAVGRFVSVTGDRYLVDATALRSGEEWDDRLRELIEAADVFQLFWSHNSMNSEFVRREWDYALRLGRDGFVRPVYWEEPFPEDPTRGLPPEALRRLHFSRLGIEPSLVSRLVRPPAQTSDVEVQATLPEVQAKRPEVQATLPEGNVAASRRPERRPLPGELVCADCGSPNEATRTFCTHCGRLLSVSSAQRPVGRRRRTILAITAAVATALVILATLALLA
jgi:hypothetical protein